MGAVVSGWHAGGMQVRRDGKVAGSSGRGCGAGDGGPADGYGAEGSLPKAISTRRLRARPAGVSLAAA